MAKEELIDRAIALARREAESRGHPWGDPVEVRRTLRHIRVQANRGSRGGGIRVTLDRTATRVIKYWIAPR